MTAFLRPRRGAALLLALLIVLVLDCVIIGTLHLAMLERTIADNVGAALSLRLAAEGAVRAAPGDWSAELDSLPVGASRALPTDRAADGIRTSVRVERLGDRVFLVRAEARLPAPSVAVAAASLLLRPPPLPPGIDPAGAALSARAVELLAGARIGADTAAAGCAAVSVAVRVTDAGSSSVSGSATVDGAVLSLTDDDDLAAHLPRVAALGEPGDATGLRLVEGDFVLGGDLDGVLLVTGNLTLAPGATLTGLAITGGDMLVRGGAAVRGAVHVAGTAVVAGELLLNACAVHDAVASADLILPGPLPGRAWLPAFQ